MDAWLQDWNRLIREFTKTLDSHQFLSHLLLTDWIWNTGEMLLSGEISSGCLERGVHWVLLFLWNMQVAVLILTKIFRGNHLCLSLLGDSVFVFPSLYSCVYWRHEWDTNTMFDNICPTTPCHFQIKYTSAEARHTNPPACSFILIRFFAPRTGNLTDLLVVSCTFFRRRQESLKEHSWGGTGYYMYLPFDQRISVQDHRGICCNLLYSLARSFI